MDVRHSRSAQKLYLVICTVALTGLTHPITCLVKYIKNKIIIITIECVSSVYLFQFYCLSQRIGQGVANGSARNVHLGARLASRLRVITL